MRPGCCMMRMRDFQAREGCAAMRILLQRVKKASVDVGGHRIAQTGAGYLLLVGMGAEDIAGDGADIDAMASKVLNLRVMADEENKMNRRDAGAR